MAFKIYAYNQGSRSARELARGLEGRVLLREGSRYRPNGRDFLINWGSGQLPYRENQFRKVFNEPRAIEHAANKLNSFIVFSADAQINIPRFWQQRNQIPDDAFPVVCRTILRGHSGRGIVIANTREELVNAPLYVEYIRKTEEYRVHIGRNEEQSITIAVQRKARRTDFENPNWQVRNHDNGFNFVREGVNPDPEVIRQAELAVQALGLDFGAVDIIWNYAQRRPYVLEVNTACGLEGQTIQDYVNFFRQVVQ